MQGYSQPSAWACSLPFVLSCLRPAFKHETRPPRFKFIFLVLVLGEQFGVSVGEGLWGTVRKLSQLCFLLAVSSVIRSARNTVVCCSTGAVCCAASSAGGRRSRALWLAKRFRVSRHLWLCFPLQVAPAGTLQEAALPLGTQPLRGGLQPGPTEPCPAALGAGCVPGCGSRWCCLSVCLLPAGCGGSSPAPHLPGGGRPPASLVL